MGDPRQHASELEELGQIDYFLEHLARAVERGEVHRASYDVLAPRYLARRAELVRVLTGQPATHPDDWIRDEDLWDADEAAASAAHVAPDHAAAAPTPASRAVVPPGAVPSQPLLGAQTAAQQAPLPAPQWPEPTPVALAPARPAPHREPVGWTTVLLFLGAFLVISASAIFALTVWNSVGALVKLGFLGAATLAFYAAGYFARTKLKLMAGSTALTVVGSAMLVFDCWIVIDSYHLTGPLPWAVALLLISAVYWLTEVVFGQRIYGVAGAAAQVAWWWLAADGLHLDPVVRVAVIAVVGVGWQLLAARAVEEDALHSLSEVLLWAAPVVEVLAALGAIFALLRHGPTDIVVVATAAVVSASGAIVALRTEHVAWNSRPWIAAALQVPLFLAVLLGNGPSWTGVAFLVALTAVYMLSAMTLCGAAMTLPAALAEVLAASAALDLLHVHTRGSIATAAALGVSWLVAAFVISTVAEHPLPTWLSRAEETGRTLRILGFIPLVGASVAAVLATPGPLLFGADIVSADVVLVAFVLAAWALAALIPRSPGPVVGAVVWSFYALGVVLAWAAPQWTPAFDASALVVLAAVWLFTRGELQRLYRVRADVFGAAMRVLIGVFLLVGLTWQHLAFGHGDSQRMVLLIMLAALAYLIDAAVSAEATSAVGGAIALAAASVANATYISDKYVCGVLAVFGLAWILAARFVESHGRKSRADDVMAALRWGGFAVLAAACVSVPFLGAGLPLSGVAVAWADAALAAAILALWVAAAMTGRDPETAIGTAAWSIYALAAVLAASLPAQHSGFYASAILVLAAGWLFARGLLQRYFRVDAEQFGWAMRVVMLATWGGGLVAESYFFARATSWSTLALSAIVCVVFTGDALLADEPISAAVAGVALVFAADRFGWLVRGPGPDAMLAGVAAVAGAGVAWVIRRAWGDRARALALASAVALTVACLPRAPGYWAAGALALAAVAWALAAATAWEQLAFASALAGLASLGALLSVAGRPGWVTVALFGVAALVLGVPSVYPATRKGGPHEVVGTSLALAGGLGLTWLAFVGAASRYSLSTAGWLDIGRHGFAIALLLLGAFVVSQAAVRRIEPLLYVGCLLVLGALFSELRALRFTTPELFSTPTALYLVAMGYLYQWWDEQPPRVYPVVLDLGAVVIGLGVPVVLALTNTIGQPMVEHTAWAIGLSLATIGAGVLARSRTLLFGGAAALAIVAGWRTLSYLAELWWLVLGLIGIALLVIALTWERQRQLIGETRALLRDGFENWR